MKTQTIRWTIAIALLVFAGWIFLQSSHWCPVSVAIVLCVFALGVLFRVRLPRSKPEPHYKINSRKTRPNSKTRT